MILAFDSQDISAISGKEASSAEEGVIPVQNGDVLLCLIDLDRFELAL